MATYEEEHGCEGDRPTLLSMARFLIDYGLTPDFQTMFQSSRQPPPTSEKFIASLETIPVTNQLEDKQCPICLKQFKDGKHLKKLPCSHHFHVECILPWLNKTSSCPVCRFELPTDDPNYEEHKKQKFREKEREEDIKSLHNSMFT